MQILWINALFLTYVDNGEKAKTSSLIGAEQKTEEFAGECGSCMMFVIAANKTEFVGVNEGPKLIQSQKDAPANYLPSNQSYSNQFWID